MTRLPTTSRMICLVACLLAAIPVLAGEDANDIDSARRDLLESLKQLKRASMTPGPTGTSGPHVGLREQIERLNALRTSDVPQVASPEMKGAPEAGATSRPADFAPDANAPAGPTTRPAVAAALLNRIAAEGPADAGQALALAEALSRNGQRDKAAEMYALALDGELDEADAQWALMQQAACFEPVDPGRARGVYKRLLSDYPDSAWSEIAAARVELIEWRTRNEVEKVLADSRAEAQRVTAEVEAIRATQRPGTAPAGGSAEAPAPASRPAEAEPGSPAAAPPRTQPDAEGETRD